MPSTFRLTDPAQMRALAHPLRLRALGLLRRDGPATATALAARLGESVTLLSYHLRQLALHGFVEEAPELARDGRERWWRSTHDFTSWSAAEFLDSPEAAAAEDALTREVLGRYDVAIDRWVRERASWGREWVEAADMSDWFLDLTAEEAAALRDEIRATVERRLGSRRRRSGREHVRLIVHLFPWRDEAQ